MHVSDAEGEQGTYGTVLVIHDYPPEQLELMSTQLRQFGCKVLSAAEGRFALAVAAAEVPDLIILSLPMRDMKGSEFCSELRTKPILNTIPLLLVSSLHKDSSPVLEALKSGADAYLRVPHDPMQLLRKAATLIERRRAAETSRQRERYFRLLMEHSTTKITVLNQEGNTLYESPSAERFTGYKAEEFLYRNNFGLIHPDDRERVVESFRAGLLGDQSGSPVQYRHRHKSGAWRIFESDYQRSVSDSGNALVIISSRDVTELKQIEDKLKKSQAELADTQRLGHIGSFEWDVDSDQWKWSDELFRIFGLEPQSIDINSSGLARHLSAEGKEAVMALFERAVADRQPFTFEHAAQRADDTTGILRFQGQIVPDEAGERPRVTGTVQDITELKLCEEALLRSKEQFRQSQKTEAVGRLTGGVAHDFNNLLTVITGYSDLVFNRLNQADPLRYHIGEIKKASNRASSLTHQLLALSRRRVLESRVMDLNTIIRDLATMLGRLIGEDIHLQTILAPTLGSVQADPGHIEQVILNLVINARDAMPEGGNLTIETHNIRLEEDYVGAHIGISSADYVMIAISDTGRGINETDKAQIFLPFFTTKEAGKGTGLGLSTVHDIVQESGGYIWVYSEVDKGTTFKIYLPRVDKKPEEHARAAEVRPVPRGTETVLVVEDEEILRTLVREVLESYGYHVLEASNGRNAISLCEQYQQPIHLLLTDVVMPGISGQALAAELQQTWKELRVLYMSGYTTDAILRLGIAEPGVHLIQKPFNTATLARMVRKVLEPPEAKPPLSPDKGLRRRTAGGDDPTS